MAGRLERWINKAIWRRCNREELNDFLADHFTGEISEDEEIACSEGFTPAEMRRLRHDFEK
ncbi:MAG TPA: hypothetical protein PLW51_00845 [Bacillota bacterium]|jgi:hypothetical protein|nr:hypothetical protein [Bacillota bacterium]NMD33358.1 hypothetical protein [Bacillota bacterium]HOB28157.1 hypothetical protein [Bacillota bacterium]HPZ40764.1 hypothetical protein [Bacillota bacterium]HQD51723.1 hypothetical protein [Bacillota bacterium]